MRLLQDVTLGQYYPGRSFLHSLDPRSKLVSLVIMIITVFRTDQIIPLLLISFLVLLLGRSASFSLPFLLKGVGIFFWFFAFTSIFHMFFTPGDSIHPFPLWGLDVTVQGLERGCVVFLQLFLVIFLANIFTLTTEPMDLTRSLEKMLSPLKFTGIDAEEVSLMISLVIRFIPILKVEAQKIMDAQRGRGVDFNKLPLSGKVRNLTSLMGPLFRNIFSRSDAIVLAMVSRCYGMGGKKGMLRELRFRWMDILSLLFVLIFCLVSTFQY